MLIAKILCCILLLITPALIIRSGLLSAKAASSFGAAHGYRSDASLSSPEAWAHAQKIVGTRYPIVGVLLAIVSLYFMICAPVTNALSLFIFWSIIFGFEIVILLCAMVSIELSLQSRFKKASA